jgi:1-deoxy-D-xylulose-5-phosphate synthase
MGSDSMLGKINGPDDLKKLNRTELEKLCSEIREELIETIATNGGHLASNLGVVELTVALHRVFDSPNDQIVWDVGHQCYPHKLLTGRYKEFHSIRKLGGLSGFTRSCESEHDPFGAGHSSTSISAAFGLAKAKMLKNEDGHVVAVLGDGSLTGGLAYEGMNNAGRSKAKLLVILNDNKMSISKSVGAIARHLAVIRVKPWYFNVKDNVEWILLHTPLIGQKIRNALIKSKSVIKNILYHSTIFEEMGFYYLGPVDGHDIDAISNLLRRAKKLNCPVFLHLITVKGKGYTFAEQDPRGFHGVSKFDIDTGDPIDPTPGSSFSDVFGKLICTAAENDDKICAITAAMTSATGLTQFAEQYKDRFFDVGIAEEHAVVFAAGLAKNGMIPVVAVYSTFLQRAYDQILHDVAIQKLKVVFAIDRAGIVGTDGETHQGLFDTAFLNSVPHMTIYSPSTNDELRAFLYDAIYGADGPAAVRYPRCCEYGIPEDFTPAYGSFDLYGKGGDVLIVTYGRLFSEAAAALAKISGKGIGASILKINRIKPIAQNCFDIASRFKTVLFFEEGIQSGGIGEHFGIVLNELGFDGKFRLFAIKDAFVEHGGVTELLSKFGLDSRSIAETVFREFLK